MLPPFPSLGSSEPGLVRGLGTALANRLQDRDGRFATHEGALPLATSLKVVGLAMELDCLFGKYGGVISTNGENRDTATMLPTGMSVYNSVTM